MPTAQPRPPWRSPLRLLLAVHLALATLFSLIVPLGEAPDEADHYAYVVFIGTQGRLPVGPAITQGKHPPLYHGLGAALTAWTGLDFDFLRANPDAQHGPDAIYPNHFIHTRLEDFPWQGGSLAMHLLRFFSALLSTVTVWGVFALARTLAPGRPALALAAAGFVGFLPGFLFSSGAVSNDNLAATLGTLSLLLALRIAAGGWTHRRGLALGVLLGLGLLTKVSLLVLWPVAALAVVLAPGWRSWTARLAAASLSLAPAGLIAAPWLLRNWLLYHDLLGWPLVRATVDVRQGPVDFSVLVWLASGLFKTFWGKFGAAGQIEYPAWVYVLLLLPSLAALAGLALYGFRKPGQLNDDLSQTTPSRRRRDLRFERRAQPGPLPGSDDLLQTTPSRRRRDLRFEPPASVPPDSSGAVRLAALLALSVVLSLATLVQYTGLALGTDQARLLWPVIGPLAIGFVAGLHELARRFWPTRRPSWMLIPAATFLLALIAALGLIRPAFGRPALAALPPDATPILFGAELALLEAQVDDSRHAPGQPVTVTLTWRAQMVPTQDWRVSVALRHPDDGALLAEHSNAPTHGRWPTDRWRAGDAFQEIIILNPPTEGVRPSRYLLMVQVRAFGAGDDAWLTVPAAARAACRHRSGQASPLRQPTWAQRSTGSRPPGCRRASRPRSTRA
ncbi:glycosyltransferase family 39 protein [Candidatus Amarolinea dominans]|uniref:glycosyltransferase family 39 protein n=1 Tax=Candidatus Amarolinea dominans TaxID=3140696 RepID=UPI001DE4499C|nr:glycosyltransferase family 39 protein [Anaerolineae bacterium]